MKVSAETAPAIPGANDVCERAIEVTTGQQAGVDPAEAMKKEGPKWRLSHEENFRHEPARKNKEQVNARRGQVRKNPVAAKMPRQDNQDSKAAPPIKRRNMKLPLNFRH